MVRVKGHKREIKDDGSEYIIETRFNSSDSFGKTAVYKDKKTALNNARGLAKLFGRNNVMVYKHSP